MKSFPTRVLIPDNKRKHIPVGNMTPVYKPNTSEGKRRSTSIGSWTNSNKMKPMYNSSTNLSSSGFNLNSYLNNNYNRTNIGVRPNSSQTNLRSSATFLPSETNRVPSYTTDLQSSKTNYSPFSTSI